MAGERIGTRETPTVLTERLRLILDWYKGMIAETTGGLVYTYDPEEDVTVADGSTIRNIASIWDVEVLSRFLQRSDLHALIDQSLTYYRGYLVPHDGALILDPNRLREPSSIAHSAFMLLSLLYAPSGAHDEAEIAGLADGILRQQRRDGSYRIHFGDEPDEGVEFYPGEAMLGLMETYAAMRRAKHLISVERGFAYHRDRIPPPAVAPDLLVFYANWQSQYAAILHQHAQSASLKDSISNYIFALHDRVMKARFYEEIEHHPDRQATVEVACALEGINDAFSIATRRHDERRMLAYERCIRVAQAWLLRAQRLEGCTNRERGGFGHSLRDRTQRIDVTGHVVGGFIKTARNGAADS